MPKAYNTIVSKLNPNQRLNNRDGHKSEIKKQIMKTTKREISTSNLLHPHSFSTASPPR